MRFVRFETETRDMYGIVDGETVLEINNSPIGKEYEETGRVYKLDSLKILSPNPKPGKMLCLALNYETHLLEQARQH